MRRSCWRWPFALGWLAALPAPAHGRAPFALKLEVETGRQNPTRPRPSPSGAVLVLNGMGEARRQQLADALARLVAAVDRGKNPFLVTLDDGEERKAVDELIRQAAPAFTAATALGAGRWQSPEGDVRIRPVLRCAPRARCISLDEPPGADGSERRARFLAWPLGYAVVLAAASREQVDAVAEALRAPGSTQIALVLTSRELHRLRASPALAPLLAHACHVVKAAPAKRSALLDVLAGIASAATAKDELPWLDLPRDAILVVPRLGALATSDAFVADVRARLAAAPAPVEWLASPH